MKTLIPDKLIRVKDGGASFIDELEVDGDDRPVTPINFNVLDSLAVGQFDIMDLVM